MILMKRTSILLLLCLLCTGTLLAANTFLGLYGGYFSPKDERFKEVYGNGYQIGSELSWKMQEMVSLQFGFFYQTATGELSISKEDTKIKIIPITCSVRIQKPIKMIVPYVGVGFGFYYFHESNVIGTVSDSKFGFLGEAGILVWASERIGLDLRYRYDTCKVKPTDITANIGGSHFILGLIYNF